jgi:predicted GIY-YIG superfamily endonuclease
MTAVEEAPAEPGVYFLLDQDHRLLYVGKASSLRRRLADHSRQGRWASVGSVRYERVASEAAALAREADILAALRPPWNKAHVDSYFAFVTLSANGLVLGPTGDYGCFPHLGRGALSESGRACIDGFDALARLVKATQPEHRLVHEFLIGTTDSLLGVELDTDQPHVRHGWERDRRTAHRFYEAGPRAVRALRLRHGGRGLVSSEQFIAWITAEVEVLLGGPVRLAETLSPGGETYWPGSHTPIRRRRAPAPPQ